MERYQEYQPTGVDWLPEVPTSWEVKKLKHCFRFTVGGTPTTSKASYFEGDNTWVTIADMHHRVVAESKTCISDEAIVAASMEIVPEGSLMYSFKLSVGKVAFAGRDLYTNEAIFSVLPEPDYDLTYFYFALPELLVHSAGQNIYGAKIFNQELLKNAFIALPPLPEQRAIARFLDDKTAQIDQLITQKQQMLELLREERAALINHAVTKGLNADAPLRNSEIEWLGEVPAHWEVKKLKHCFKFTVGGTPTTSKASYFEGENTWVTIADMHQRVVSKSKTCISDDAIEAASMEVVPQGALMYSFKLSVGKVAFAGKDLYTNEAIFSVLPEPEYDLTYFYFALPKLLINSAGQNIYGAKIFNQELLKNAFITFPPLTEQRIIARFLDAKSIEADSIMKLVDDEIALLQEYRAALIAEAVTGQIDVRHYEPTVLAVLM